MTDNCEMNNDLISREALKKAMDKKALDLANGGMIFIESINHIIDNAPTIERPQGEWICKPVTFGTCILQGYECNCGRVVMQRENFCPECGAEMQKDKNDSL